MYKTIDDANKAVVEKIVNAQVFLIDVVPAASVIPELGDYVLLHAGPPIQYREMTGPMQGSCIGAILFEDWASNADDALKMLESGRISFIPCHHVNAVGPMGGITSKNMPVLVVENRTEGNRAYCTMNEGIGKVLRFGAYDSEVVNRLKWMQTDLAPALSKTLAQIESQSSYIQALGKSLQLAIARPRVALSALLSVHLGLSLNSCLH